MSELPAVGWTDDRIVQYIRTWSIERSKCGFNVSKANRISDTRLFPCRAILAARGPASLRKLLPLLQEDNTEVRLVAASFAYDAEPATCRRALEELMEKHELVALLAWATLAYKDPMAAPFPPVWSKDGAPGGGGNPGSGAD